MVSPAAIDFSFFLYVRRAGWLVVALLFYGYKNG